MVHYISKDNTVKKIVKATFPSYNGRKFKLSTKIPNVLSSYWSGGSRDSFVFYALNTGKTFSVLENHPYFQAKNPRDLESLPPGIVVVKHSISGGKDMGITIYANQQDLSPLLSTPSTVFGDEKIVLKYTSELKPSYAGIKNYRFYEANRCTGITLERWTCAKDSLISKKLLNKKGAITPNGRNVLRG